MPGSPLKRARREAAARAAAEAGLPPPVFKRKLAVQPPPRPAVPAALRGLRIDPAEVRAELARRSLKDFIRYAWPLVEPDAPLTWSWHLDVLCEVLEAVTRGDIQRVIINVPPGTGKSLVVSVFHPAWEWATQPGLRYLTASYGAHLTIRDNLRLRAIVTSPWYQRHFKLELSGDQNSKIRFDTVDGGWRIATSVGGVGTGEHPDRIICLDGDAEIATDRGLLPIRAIVEQRLPVRVLGSSGAWQRVTAYERGPGRPMVDIVTASGARLRCTEDHPVYLEGRGFIPASTLIGSTNGNLHMRSLRVGVQPLTESRQALEHGGSLLFAPMPRPRHEGVSASAMDAIWPALRALRRAGGRLSERTAAPSLLLSHLPQAVRDCLAATGVSDLPRLLLSAWGPDLLQPSLCGGGASDRGPRGGERTLQARPVDDRLRPWLHQEAEERDTRQGLRVRSLWTAIGDFAGASHRRLQGGPRADQPRDALRELPPQGPYQGRDSADVDEGARVAVVRGCGAPAEVYNIRTEPDHDYYANGLLVHNCDDPITADQARSEAERRAVIDWFDRTISSRGVIRDARTVIIMQRLHQEDLSGHLLAKGGWEHVMFPMRFDPKRADARDRRTEPGELLWPELFNEERVRQLEYDLGPYGAAGQLQQAPAPEGGGLFKREWFGVPVPVAPAKARRCRGWDTAGTEGGGDWTVGVKLADADGVIYVEDVVRAQVGAAGVDMLMAQTAALDGKACAQREEREGGSAGKAVIASRAKLLAGYDYAEVSISGDKVTRAKPFRAQCEAGNVKLVAGPWNEAYLQVLESFPTGRHDDDVDGSSCAYNSMVQDAPYTGQLMARPAPSPHKPPVAERVRARAERRRDRAMAKRGNGQGVRW